MIYHTKGIRFGYKVVGCSLVKVFRAEGNRKGEFLRYETPEGVECDEHGVELGVVHFKIKGVRV